MLQKFGLVMPTCRKCSVKGTPDEPLAICDRCSTPLCKSCAGLQTTELRAVVLKKRLVVYYCSECHPCVSTKGLPSADSPAIADSSLLALVKVEIAKVTELIRADLERTVRQEIKPVADGILNLRQSNIDLVRLLTDVPTPSSLMRSESCGSTLESCPGKSGIAGYHIPPSIPASCSVPEEPGISVSAAGESTLLHSKGPSSSKNIATVEPSGTSSTSTFRKPSSGKLVSGPKSSGGLTAPSRNLSRQSAARDVVIGSRRLESPAITAASLPKKTSIFVSRLDKQVTADDLHLYLTSTFGSDHVFVVEEQTVRTGEYRAFRVQAKLELLSDLLSSSNWPENVLIKKFRFFRSRTATASQK